ncbi:unnamed protein product [Hermetia illucens]|uniref:Heparan sulfate 2-O-sulfotransferase pipe n=1 Tax=Hermetia illucens TaxID=343691 RepID=A0A7R8ULW6_HERIL|nr:unnamed protein product [Hermetia illucens]
MKGTKQKMKWVYISHNIESDLKGVHGTYQYLKSTGQIRRYSPDELNNTKRAEMDLIFFNRVPKVGSQKLMALMKNLGKVNGYSVGRDPANSVETILLTEDEQQDLAEEVADIEEPAAYSKHVAFVNFTHFDVPRPIYINLVRDPVERIISWFYYIRAPWYFVERKMINDKLPLPKPAWLRKDFESCIKNGDKECQFSQNVVKEGVGDHRRQTLFFCGQDKSICLPFNSAKAMQIAKRTVEKEYAVVGSWEETNITLAVLEKYIPKFFRRASVVYYQAEQSLNKINKNMYKPPVSEEVKNILRKNLTNEIEFYQFCMQRLYRQYEAIRLN